MYTLRRNSSLHCISSSKSVIHTTRKVEYPESGVAQFGATPVNRIDPASMRIRENPGRIIWQAISLANRRLTGCWKLKNIGGASCVITA